MEEEREPSRQEVQGDQNAISMYGDASVHIHPPPISSVLPERVWMIPYRRNPFFTGREELLRGLHERFTRDRAAVLTQGQAINGLGGIGKTQIAVEYAYQHQQDYRFVLWASAASPETMQAAYVSIADRLQLPERTEQKQDKIVAAVLHWLSTYEEWLLIADNADEMETIWPLLPTGSTGHLLLTTRDQIVRGMERFEVKPLDHAEGMLLLVHRAGILKKGMTLQQLSQADRESAEQIVIEMDGLPLALDQAGAYIEETECTLQDYLAVYRQRRLILLADRGRMADHPAPVATTWDLSFKRVEQRTPAAADLLRVCAFLAPDAIPEELIIKGARYLGPRLPPMEVEPSSLQEMLRTLRTYSLIRRDVKEKTLSVHRLVQAILKDSLHQTQQRVWAERTICAVNAAFPKVEHGTWPQCEQLLPHALLAVQFIDQYQMNIEEAGRLLYETASYLVDRVRYEQAEPLYLRALHIREQQLGPEHPDVAQSLNGLARLYFLQGKYGEAEPLYQRASHIIEQQLGPEHPQVAYPLTGLANLYSEQGKDAEAESLYLRALHIWEQQLGPEHPQVASSLNNLAILYRSQGKYGEVEPLLQRALRIWEQQLGPEHPNAAKSLNDLAILYHQQGKYGEAEPLYLRALRIWEQQLGPEHPDVAQSLNGLANLYFRQGKYTEAEPLFQRALRIWEQQLGPEHPNVAYPLNNLANLYSEQGKNAEAESLYLRALRIWEQQLGPEHPQVAHPLNGLANIYNEQGKYTEAEPLFQRALHIWEQQLGPEHLFAATPLHNLANLYRNQGKYAQVEPLFQRALRILEQQLGPEHPETAETMHDLAQFWETQGSSEEARAEYARALAVREQALGAHHPKTTETRTRLIALLHTLGQHEEAARFEATQSES